MKLTGDARRWRQLDGIKAAGERYRLTTERDAIRRRIVEVMRTERNAITRNMTVAEMRKRLEHVIAALAAATARENAARRDLGEV